MALRSGRRFQFSRNRPRRLRSERPRRQRPAAARAGRRLSLYRSRHLSARRNCAIWSRWCATTRPTRSRVCRSGLRLVRPDGVEVERRQLDRRPARRLSSRAIALPRDARIGSLAGRIAARPESAADRQSPSSASRISCRRSSRSRCPPPTGRSAPARRSRSMSRRATITARRGPDWRWRPRRSIALDEDPFPNAAGLPVRPRRRGIHRRRPRHRGAGDRRATASRPLRSTLNDLPDLTRPLAATMRVSVFEPSGRAVYRNRDPADPATPAGDRAALARRRRGGAGRAAEAKRRDHRASIPKASGSPPRGCAGNCCARPGNTAGIRSTASGATDRRCATSADRRRHARHRRR